MSGNRVEEMLRCRRTQDKFRKRMTELAKRSGIRIREGNQRECQGHWLDNCLYGRLYGTKILSLR